MKRIQTVFEFTNEERLLLQKVLFGKLQEILDETDGKYESLSNKSKEEYDLLYGIYYSL